MKNPQCYLPLLIIFLSLAFQTAVSFKTIKKFTDIIINTHENLYIDLNDYFVGNNLQFSVDVPLSVQDKYQISSSQDNFTISGSNILAIDPPRDVFGDWTSDDPWIFLDNNKTLYLFAQAGPKEAPTLSLTKNITFNTDLHISCVAMLRLSPNLLAISCLNNGQPYQILFDLVGEKIYSGWIETTVSLQPRFLEKFANNSDYLITYSTYDPKNVGSAEVIVYDISNRTNVSRHKIITAKTLQISALFLQRLVVVEKTFFLADYRGSVYRVDNLMSDSSPVSNSFLIDENLAHMTVVFDSYRGQATTTLAVESKTYIYHFDWTDPTNAVSINKYPVHLDNQIQDVRHVEISQDFISTIVTKANGECKIIVYRLGQSLPEEIYYQGDCPIDTYLVHTSRSSNSILFLTDDSTSLSLSVNQIFRSILNITIPNPGQITSTIHINDQPEQKINIQVVESQDFQVITTNALDDLYFGLTVPGYATFDATGLFHGPFLTFEAIDDDFDVLPYSQNITSNLSQSTSQDQLYAVYSSEDCDTIYWFYAINQTITLQTCIEASNIEYGCSVQTTMQINSTVLNMTVSDSYLFLLVNTTDPTTSKSSITILVYNYDLTPSGFNLPLPNVNDTCKTLMASQSPLSPFLYCLGNTTVYVFRVDDLSTASSTSRSLNVTDLKMNMIKSVIQLNHNFLSVLFLQTDGQIHLIDTFAVMKGAQPIISSIQIEGTLDTGYSFAVGGQSLVYYVNTDLLLVEYDISHPRSPVLIKYDTAPIAECLLIQMLGDSQNADNIYFFARSAFFSDYVVMIYQPQTMGYSNYLTFTSLPSDLFPDFIANFFPPRYPIIPKLGQGEVLFVPNNNQLGYYINTQVLVNYAMPTSNETNTVDYQEMRSISFTANGGSRNSSSSVANVTANIIFTDEKVNAIEALYYPPGFTQVSAKNIISIDPRICFNGSISNYSIEAATPSETRQIQLTQQVNVGDPISLGKSGLYGLEAIGESFLAQAKSSVLILNDGKLTTIPISKQKLDITCDHFVYNLYTDYVFSACLESTSNRYYFSIFSWNDATPIQEVFVDSRDAGKIIDNVQKVIFTSKLVFILANNQTYGSFIHIFSFQAPNQISYTTSVTSADLHLDSFNIVDFTINSQYDSDNYRLFLLDPKKGLLTLDIIISTILTFTNPQISTLEGPSNANWNGITTVNEQRELDLPTSLLITSPTYKNYYVKYHNTTGVEIIMDLISIPNSNVIKPCYTDEDTFIITAYSSGLNYALLYSVSDSRSRSNSQNFPLLSAQYNPPVSGACSLAFDKKAINGPSFYVDQSFNISNYTVSTNLVLIWDKELSSNYIKIRGNGINNYDVFDVSLKSVPSQGPSLLLLILIIGGVALLILIAILFYCHLKSKKQRDESDSYYASLVSNKA